MYSITFFKNVNQKDKLTAPTLLFLCVPGECFEFWFTGATNLKDLGRQV